MQVPLPAASARGFLQAMWSAAGGPAQLLEQVGFTGTGDLPSVFAVSDLAAGAVAAAGAALAELVACRFGAAPTVQVDRRLASFWFATSLRPQGWALPPAWDAVAGDYPTADGWIRLHTNAPHHRDAALAVLGVAADRDQVAQAVAGWQADALEAAVVASRGCAAAMRSTQAWAEHPQGRAVAAEPLLHTESFGAGHTGAWPGTRARPLAGLRVLDLTRVLAGPVATRFLAGYGAQVLRIDPPWWDEPSLAPEVTPGKRCARLDLREPADRARFEQLLAGADVLVHGYRADALAKLGLDVQARQHLRPGLVDVCLDAYGWSGPWHTRRGFDSLVQMSSGITEMGMRKLGKDKPTPLPVQALDHAAGYLIACAVLRGLSRRAETGAGCTTRTSLARVAALLTSAAAGAAAPLAAETPEDLTPGFEATAWGPARRLKPPLLVEGAELHWDLPAGLLGSAPAAWRPA
jgi:crotonobetainyl-CoA:carnitine CoA-transferase CaiB-like acyl-CoA transferase